MIGIDRRSNIGKMLDDTKVVYFCTICNRRFVGDINTYINKCPKCLSEGTDTLVIDGTLVVRK